MHSPEDYSVMVVDGGNQSSENHHIERPKGDMNKFHFPTSNGLANEAAGVRKHFLTGKSLHN